VAPSKVRLAQPSLEFLGLKISANGISPTPDKVSLIQDWPKPRTLTELRSFLGLTQFFRRFIRDYAKLASPLTNLTKKDQGIQRWSIDCDHAFTRLKEALISAPILRHVDWSLPFNCHVDASGEAVGGTLTQVVEGKEHAIAFFSHRLTPAESKYSANDRELLALVAFLKRFRCYLEGSEFQVFTDNQVLKHFFDKKDLSRREAGYLALLTNFGIFPINLQRGRIHVLGDSPSRAPHAQPELALSNIEIAPSASQRDIAKDQYFGPIYAALNAAKPSNNISRRLKLLSNNYALRDGLLRVKATNALCVPRKMVPTLLRAAHDSATSGHTGFVKTLVRLDDFYWKKKYRDVKAYVQGCQVCQRSKANTLATLTEPQVLPFPSRRWGSVSIDFIVQLPKTSRGFDAITTFVDRFSKRPHFCASKTTDDAVATASQFLDVVYKQHGLPDSIVSDRDSKFCSLFWKELTRLLGISLLQSTAFHPQTDGQSEVMNRMVETYLRSYCSFHQDDWDLHLPLAEFSYSSAAHALTGVSPFVLDLGWQPRHPIDFLSKTSPATNIGAVQDLQATLSAVATNAATSYADAQAIMIATREPKHRPPNYSVGDLVWLESSVYRDAFSRAQPSAKLAARRVGPFPILQLVGRNAVRLALPPTLRIHPVVNVSWTKPCRQQPRDLAAPVIPPPSPVAGELEHPEFVVDQVLAHRRRRGRFWFLTRWKGYPDHEASWEPARNFIDPSSIVSAPLLAYLRQHSIPLSAVVGRRPGRRS